MVAGMQIRVIDEKTMKIDHNGPLKKVIPQSDAKIQISKILTRTNGLSIIWYKAASVELRSGNPLKRFF